MNWVDEHASLSDTSISSMNTLDDEITLSSISIFGATDIHLPLSVTLSFSPLVTSRLWRR
jgi:hypothetical protein